MKKYLALILAAVLIFATIPLVTAFAETPTVIYVKQSAEISGDGSAESPVKTINEAIAIGGTANDFTVMFVDTYTTVRNEALTLHTGTITFSSQSGGVFKVDSIFTNGPTVFKNISTSSVQNNNWIQAQQYEISFGENVVHDNTDAIKIHKGRQNADSTKQNLNISSGKFNIVYIGSYYVTTGNTKTTAGADIKIDGGNISNLILGPDSYSGVYGCVDFTDTVNIAINGGTVGSVKNRFLATDNPTVYYASYQKPIQIILNNGATIGNYSTLEADLGGASTTAGGLTVISSTSDGFVEATATDGVYKITSEMNTVIIDGEEATSVGENLYEIGSGKHNITYANQVGTITVKYDDGRADETYAAGGTYTFPSGEDKQNEIFYGWILDDKKYFAGDTITLSATTQTINLTAGYVVEGTSVYIDAANGSDTNTGYAENSPLKTMEAATKAVGVFKGSAKLVIIGTFSGTSITLPKAAGGLLTVSGGKLEYSQSVTLTCDTVFENITFKCTGSSKSMAADGYNVTFGNGIKKEGNEVISIRLSKIQRDVTGDQTVKVQSGEIKLCVGPYYITDAQMYKTWTGNFYYEQTGGNVTIQFGDGYSGHTGKFNMNGNMYFDIKGGQISYSEVKNYLGDAGNTFILNRNKNNNLPLPRANIDDFYIINFGGVDAEFDKSQNKLITNEACYVGISNYKAGDEITLVKGENTLCKGETVKSGLTVLGAQIRTSGKQGLRFIAKYDASMKVKYKDCEFGFIYIPEAVLAGEKLEANKTYNYLGEDFVPTIVEAKNIYEHHEDYDLYTVCITGIKKDYLSYAVTTYIKDGNKYIYGDSYAASVYEIADYAIKLDKEGTQKLEENVKEIFQDITSGYSSPKEKLETLYGTAVDLGDLGPYTNNYSINDANVREITLDALFHQNNNVTIGVVADNHFNVTKTETLGILDKVVEMGKIADRFVFAGDSIDYLTSSNGVKYDNLNYFKENALDKMDNEIAIMGNHEYMNQTSTDIAELKELWEHDISYYSVLSGKVLIVGLDNGQSEFSESQCDKLEADIARAREYGYSILIFEHIRIDYLDKNTAQNQRMYDIQTSNSDVILAAFSGHNDVDLQIELPSTYINKDGEIINTKLSCYQLKDSKTEPNLLFITIK